MSDTPRTDELAHHWGSRDAIIDLCRELEREISLRQPPADVAELVDELHNNYDGRSTIRHRAADALTALTARIEQETIFNLELIERIGKDAERIAELEAEIKNLESTPKCGIDGCKAALEHTAYLKRRKEKNDIQARAPRSSS